MAGGGVQGFVMDQSVNLAIAICIGLAVGFFEDVPINLVPDALIFGLTLAMIAQEVLLVQRTGYLGGRYEDEMRDYTRSMLEFFDNKAFWLFGILSIFFVLGMIPLILSSRDIGALSVARILFDI